MEQVLRPIYQERASQESTLGILLIGKQDELSPLTDTFDNVLLIITKEQVPSVYTKHYTYEDKKAVLHTITARQLRKWLLLGTNRKVVDWLMHGRIIYDRNEYVSDLRTELRDFPFYGRKIKMGIEFARLIRRYLEGKVFFEERNHLDAYHHVVESLHHLARMAVIKNGLPPEVTIWAQVKQMEPQVYKLYEEMVTSEEPIDKRLELLFLAGEHLIHSRTEDGAMHIREVMAEQELWTIQELHEEEELRNYSSDLEVFIEFLISKKLIATKNMPTKSEAICHRYYFAAPKE
ncbi:nucleotidyltransferase-like protein [Indiicoccus explosivorum]|uniref:nucleotidyltransferase-like protein n=1 Tax=Indiicoccus explosivorum TaxID=1917864 RepID=UPI000B42DF49|nr:nucleotidyltransferase-like protein [Indiicoccus explosivorum]